MCARKEEKNSKEKTKSQNKSKEQIMNSEWMVRNPPEIDIVVA